jgi:hypothetical protein
MVDIKEKTEHLKKFMIDDNKCSNMYWYLCVQPAEHINIIWDLFVTNTIFDYDKLPVSTLGFFAFYYLIQSESKSNKSDKETQFELSLKLSSMGINHHESMSRYVLYPLKITKEIVKYYKNAADNGDSMACICLAEFYIEGKNNKKRQCGII